MDRRTWLRAALAAGPLAALAGCAAGKADVSGRVTYKGKPVASGTVIARGPDGIEMVGSIQPDGSYTVQGVTAGQVRFAVVSRNVGATQGRLDALKNPRGGKEHVPASAPQGDDKWFAIPAKFESPDTSEVTATLKSGANQFDVVLQ